jgi:hypothetical protein
MESLSRRAFLMGRRSAPSPWESFCRRVRRTVSGSLFDFGLENGVGSARLVPRNTEDVQHARALCVEYEVVLALDGVAHAAAQGNRPVLWVEPGIDMAMCQRMSEDSRQWYVQPGCLVGDLQTAGLPQFNDAPCHITVAAWLADRMLCDWPCGQTWRSGLSHASVMLADGTRANLGPFGKDNTKALDTLTLQRLVSGLFELSAQDRARVCGEQAAWPGRYRLDALLPEAGHTVNLSHLLLGHGGDLVWVEWLVFDELDDGCGQAPAGSDVAARRRAGGAALLAANELDSRIKALFDPSGIFPAAGQDL